MNECKHKNIITNYTHITCVNCRSIKTDSDRSWGIAKSMWFSSLEEAEFYQLHGRLPETIKKENGE